MTIPVTFHAGESDADFLCDLAADLESVRDKRRLETIITDGTTERLRRIASDLPSSVQPPREEALSVTVCGGNKFDVITDEQRAEFRDYAEYLKTGGKKAHGSFNDYRLARGYVKPAAVQPPREDAPTHDSGCICAECTEPCLECGRDRSDHDKETNVCPDRCGYFKPPVRSATAAVQPPAYNSPEEMQANHRLVQPPAFEYRITAEQAARDFTKTQPPADCECYGCAGRNYVRIAARAATTKEAE